MKTEEKIDIIRKDDKFIDDYLNELLPDLIPYACAFWEKKAKEISELLENDLIDALYLAVIADILFRRRKENLVLLKHSKSTSKDYIGAKDLSVFIKKYKVDDAVPLRIVIDYKTRFEKGDKSIPRDEEDYKTMDATTVTISGKKLLKLLIDPCIKGTLQELTQVYGAYESAPLFEPKTFPNTKPEFIAKHNKIAAAKISSFFAIYPELPEKEKKLNTMKVLVFMKFLDSYEKYKRLANEKSVKKVLAENEYYLQRYTDLTKVR
jgi:hypothetical protein